MRNKPGFVYILSNYENTVLYTGVTSNLPKRIWEHKENKDPKSFTARYKTSKLVYYEFSESMEGAIMREKNIKNWKRAWKNELIMKDNPDFDDLFDALFIS